ncbi:Peptidyl-Lys metalloendopeptidase [Mycena indigotica]|uniref:Peptidyl-Lys metalloendopeptidase n=1 Tax=Mycena indigotica TaxID=2126181 RepID=A0A8H6T3H5_9AGAR|nr:Peptidyl-Lys metalloendopeptidase [Mycena indigotica]KAF7310185.1 Peptidyl-Lys metalloendopeptidase [Mycena indigotica]
MDPYRRLIMFPTAFFTTFIIVTLFHAASAKPALSLALTGPREADGVGALRVTARLVNTGDVELRLLNDPRTILNKIETNSFFIADGAGRSPTFTGTFVKYSPKKIVERNRTSSFTVLAPGASVEIKHDLSRAYNFAGSGESTYDIGVAANVFHYVDPSGKLATIRANTVKANHKTALKGTLAVERRTTRHWHATSRFHKRIAYQSCSESEKEILVDAAAAAQAYADDTVKYLTPIRDGTPASSPRWAKWFGNFTTAHHAKVLDNFRKIAAQPFASYTYDCSCKNPDVFGYVVIGDSGTIYLCGIFWQASKTGSDSRAGTLIHEASHTIAETDDFEYGKDGAADLAVRNPAEAIANADNTEYFAENDPSLA